MRTSARLATLERPPCWVEPTLPSSSLQHNLDEALDQLAQIKRRYRLPLNRIYRSHRKEIDRVLGGFEWDITQCNPQACSQTMFRAVAWNIERGKRLAGVTEILQTHPDVADADLILLTETDVGMGRSHNRNVPRELADKLGLGYVFCNHELLLSLGDAFERDHGRDNTLAMHGSALLSRYPISRFTSIPLREFHDKFHADEKRLGGKRALISEVELPTGTISVVVLHLDPFASPRHRATQLRTVLECQPLADSSAPVLLGGDFNTTTYDFGTKLGFATNLLRKVRLGFDETIRQYMTPDQVFEAPLFDTLRTHGFSIDDFNSSETGTLHYNIYDPETDDWTLRYVPKLARDWLERKLRPWQGTVPMRLDWFAARGLQACDTAIVDRPKVDGEQVSDHNPIRLDFQLG